ncbi:cupredoxin domain-containing protein [Aquihabitans sp. McL0605]|uniref:cupredoxin domain-containing protein n=1 Tax=Aquihabitans sp. McL0605 TaxID=3415671 RepID=UPI003CF7B0DC
MRTRALLIVAAAAAVTAGCGNGEPAVPMTEAAVATTAAASGAAPAGPDLSAVEFTDLTADSNVTVQARDNQFVAPNIEIKAGTTVTFDNKGRNIHDVAPATPGAFKEIPPASFDPGESGKVVFTQPGDYAYYCTLHGTPTKGMIGSVRVLQ